VFQLLMIGTLRADQNAIPQIHDLQKFAIKATENKLPIVLLISQYHCEYCERIKQEVLNPMSISGNFENSALLGELLIDVGEMIIDFQGEHRV
jgi:thioredoxin-related protein